MNPDDFARRVFARIAPVAIDDERTDWHIFTAMLRATGAAIPARLQFDDAALQRAEDWLTLVENEQVDPAEDARRLTPHAVTVQQARDAVAEIYTLRDMWAAFNDLFAAEDSSVGERALIRLARLCIEHPLVYRRFDVYFHSGVAVEREASQTPEYKRCYDHFHPPHTWLMNGGTNGHGAQHFPAYEPVSDKSRK
jgi:hypothetical protein